MELLSIQRARSIWLFDTYDLNPRGRDVGSALIDWLKTAYHFTKFPSSVNDLDDSKALYYSGGHFQSKHGPISVELRIYNDGIVGDTRSSTEETDLFLAGLLATSAKEFGLHYAPHIIRKKLYVSEMTVRCGASLSSVNRKLSDFAGKLARMTGAASVPELTSIGFWQDIVPDPSGSVFRFERKWGAEFSENRYYTRAPFPTSTHLELLQELEKAIS